MRIYNSILVKLIFLVAFVEFLIMLAYEYFVPLNALIEKYVFLGPIIDTSILVLVITIAYLRVLKRPLDELIKVMNAVEKRDFSIKANDRRKDEFGIIAANFNNMGEKLKNWGNDLEQEVQTRTEEVNATNEELKASNEELNATNEELQSTTEELRQANEELKVLKEDLEKKVEERTAALQPAKEALEKKVADLERFNKLSVGRELKMKEMKARIEELEAKLKEKS